MFPAVLTTLLFAASAIASSRAARLIGPVQASLVRLVIALCVLAIYAVWFGQGLTGPGMQFFLVSGLIGFGLGDIALFHAYRKLGARLAILLAQCLAVPFAALTEWLWLGTVLTHQLFWMIAILAGVCLALLPAKKALLPRSISWSGIAFGIAAALGQAWGAVLSRKAISLNEAADLHIDGATATFQRLLAGVLITGCFYLVVKSRKGPDGEPAVAALRRADRIPVARLCLVNAVLGPILGISCYQWALSAAPSGVVLAVVATTPIVVLPLAWLLENDRPSSLSVAGSFFAIASVFGLLIR